MAKSTEQPKKKKRKTTKKKTMNNETFLKTLSTSHNFVTFMFLKSVKVLAYTRLVPCSREQKILIIEQLEDSPQRTWVTYFTPLVHRSA